MEVSNQSNGGIKGRARIKSKGQWPLRKTHHKVYPL